MELCSSSQPMTPAGRIIAGKAAAIGLLALLASACATSRPAPIAYAATRPPAATAATPRAIPPPILPATPDTSTPFIITDQPHSECVPYARNISGVQIWGDAVTWWAQAENKYVRSTRPAEGSVLVLRGWNDDRRGHVSVVKEIIDARTIRVDHANWMRGGEISINVPVTDVSPDNDWSQVRIWHVPGGYWGGRTYQVQGFIHPYRLDGGAGLTVSATPRS